MKKFMLAFFIALFTAMPFFQKVDAIEKYDDFIKVNYTVENVEDSKTSITVTIKNVSNQTLNNIKVENILPEDFILKNNDEAVIKTLKANDSITKSYVAIYDIAHNKNEEITKNNDKDDSKSENKSSVEVKHNEKESSNTNTQNKQTSKTTSQKASGVVSTGDIQKIIPILVCMGFVVIVILGIRNKKSVKKVMVLLIVGSIAVSGMNCIHAESEKSIYIEQKLNYKNKDYIFSLKISYLTEEAISNDSSQKNITRIQWLSKLVEKMNYDEYSFSDTDNYFNDVSNKNDIYTTNVAVVNQIIDTKSKNFKPDDYATREFIAVTTVKALGYDAQEDIDCLDKSQINEPAYVNIATKIDAISLENNYFYPTRNARDNEVQRALKSVQTVLDSENIDPNAENIVEYQDNAKKLDGQKVKKLEQNELTLVNDETSRQLTKGNIVVIEEYGCFKIEDITQSSSDIILQTSKPELEETFKRIDVQGFGKPNYSQFIPADGVTYTVNKNEKADDVMPLMDIEDDISLPDNMGLKISINKIIDKIPIKIPIDVELNVSFDSVKYKINLEPVFPIGVDFKNVFIKCNNTMSLNSGINSDYKLNKQSQTKDLIIPLGKVPIMDVALSSFYIDLGFKIDASGYASVSFNRSQSYGVQILNNQPRKIHEIHTKGFEVEAGAKLKAGVDIVGLLELVHTFNLVDLELFAGGAGNASLKWRAKKDFICIDLDIYPFVDLNICYDKDNLINKYLLDGKGLTWSLLNKDNAPKQFKFIGHYENSEDYNKVKKVEKCTYKEAFFTGKVSDKKTGNSIDEATVTITNTLLNEKVASVKTDSTGTFSIMLDEDENYIIEVTKDKYKSFKSDKCYLGEAITKNWDIQLEPVEDSSDKPNTPDQPGTDDKNDTDITKVEYLEDLDIIDKGEYQGNEGDSFVYTIGKHEYTRGNTGIDGTSYEHGIEAWIARWNFMKEKSWAYATYLLDGKYKNLSGKSFIIKSYNTNNFDETLEFYGDGKLLGSYQMTPDTIPFEINLDVSGVKELKINVYDNVAVEGGTSIGMADMKLD